MFGLPLAGAAFHLTDQAFGLWAGTTIHAVPQVVAAGFAYSQSAGAMATLIKLVRVTFLAPFILVLALWHTRTRKATGKGEPINVRYSRLIPPFVWGFLALAALNTADLVPSLQFKYGTFPLLPALTNGGEILLTLSMAAMGLEVDLRQFLKVGGRAFAAGVSACLILCVVSLALIKAWF
jgi:uncharacterized membrane protein YadS